MKISKIIKERTHLKESEEVVDLILIELYLRGQLSTKTLSSKTNLPIPVISAIRKELAKLGIVKMANGVFLTTKGSLYVENTLGFSSINKNHYLKIIDSNSEREWLKKEMIDELSLKIVNRPKVDVKFDQAFATLQTSIDRAFLLLDEHQLVNNQILFLGDDDLTSLAVGLLIKKISLKGKCSSHLMVYEMSENIITCIEDSAENLEIGIDIQKLDFRYGSQEYFKHQYDYVFVDPPYTITGLKLFLSRAISSSRLGASRIYLSFGEKEPQTQLAVQKLICDQNLIINEISHDFNHYEGASILGGRSNMLELLTLQTTYPIISSCTSYKQQIYTGELNPRNSVYKCKNCGETHKVGPSLTIKTIEELKEIGCSNCENTTFLHLSRNNLEATEEKVLGSHYLVELKNCFNNNIGSVSTVERIMLNIVEQCQLTKVSSDFHQFKPLGVSGVVVLAESHFTVHTWPEENYAAIDLFVCSRLASENKFMDLLTTFFEAGEIEYRKVNRGSLTY